MAYQIQSPPAASLEPSPKTLTLASFTAVVNAIVTSRATVTTADDVTGVALNGAVGAGTMTPARTISVTTTSSASTYTIAAPIVVTGTDATGAVITDTLQLTAVGGGETITGVKAFATVTDIAIPAMSTTSGHFTFGTKDYYPRQYRKMRVGTSGTLHLGYADGSSDTFTPASGEYVSVIPQRIFADSTAAAVTFMY
jgi:hypothetical protein